MESRNVETIKTSDTIFVIIDGSHLYTTEDLYRTLAETLSFPDYFGQNLDALYDMLTDLAWLPYENIYVIIKNADMFFSTLPELYDELEEIFKNALEEQTENKKIKLFLSDIHSM